MKREIITSIEGDIHQLLKLWTLPKKVDMQTYPEGLRLVFQDENISEFYNLENIIKELSQKYTINSVSFFRAYDFSLKDLMSSDLLWLRILSNPDLAIESSNPIMEYRCGKCKQACFKLINIDKLFFRTHKLPHAYLIASGNIKLFHIDLIEKFRSCGMTRSFQLKPSIIVTNEEKSTEKYFWLYSTFDLGVPKGDIELEKPCNDCGIPLIKSNRSFLYTFSRERWRGEDFCMSTFFGTDFLYISQRVYKLLDSLPVDKKGDIIFEPIKLIR